MKHSYTFYLLLLSVILTLGCNVIGQKHTTSETQHDVALEETLWKLINFQDENGRKSESGSSEITLIFHKDETLTGKSSSNTYSSEYDISNGHLDIERVITTEVGEPESSKYMVYLSALKDVQSYEISSNKLILHFGDKASALIFEAIAMEK